MVNADTYDRNRDWCWSSRGQSPAQALVQAEHFSSVQIARTRIDDRSGNYGIDWRHYALGPVALNFLSVTPQQVRRTCAMTSSATPSCANTDAMLQPATTARANRLRRFKILNNCFLQ